MKFHEHLTYFRERANMTKSALAERLNVTPSYVIHLEAGQIKPANLERCQQIAAALGLSSQEKESLVEAAMLERVSEDVLLWLHERDRSCHKMRAVVTDDILKALEDPGLSKAILTLVHAKPELRKIMQSMCLAVQNVPEESMKNVLKICYDILTRKRLTESQTTYLNTWEHSRPEEN